MQFARKAALAAIIGPGVRPYDSAAFSVETTGFGSNALPLSVSCFSSTPDSTTLSMVTINWDGHPRNTDEARTKAAETYEKLQSVGYPFSPQFISEHGVSPQRAAEIVGSWFDSLGDHGTPVIQQALRFAIPALVDSGLISEATADRIVERVYDPGLIHKAAELAVAKQADEALHQFYVRVQELRGPSAALASVYTDPDYRLPPRELYLDTASAPCCMKAVAVWAIYWTQCAAALSQVSSVPQFEVPGSLLQALEQPSEQVYRSVMVR